jgi:tetratricopeptide (TPR) repeat protein
MKKLTLALLLGLAAGMAQASSFEAGMKAVAAGNDLAALGHFEAALVGEPDSLRFANEYRRAVIRTGEYDRAIAFFDKLTAAHPQAAFAWLNYGYAYVDKIPAAGSITQVILASSALGNFTKSIELERSWIALYTRGNSAKKEAKKKPVYVRSWIALGDGYVKTDQPDKAKAIWREAVQTFGTNPDLEARLGRDGEELEKLLYDVHDPNKRVDTNLTPLLEEP